MTAPHTQHATLDTGKLWAHVDRLTRDDRQRVAQQHPGQPVTVTVVTVPCLIAQLERALGASNSGGGHGKAGVHRLPLNTGVHDLLTDMRAQARTALTDLNAHRPGDTTRAALRHLAATLVSTCDQDTVTDWARQYRRWVTQAEQTLALDTDDALTTRGIRGHACPTCKATSVPREQDGETYLDPAIVVAFRDGQLLHATCRACATGWWRGDDLDELGASS